MNTIKSKLGTAFLLLLISLLFACSKDNSKSLEEDYGNKKNGFALKTAEGHSFQFYDSHNNWLYSVATHSGKIIPEFQEGAVAENPLTFDYERVSKDEAECYVGLPFSYYLGGAVRYGGYFGRVELYFNSIKEGTYKAYDISTDIYKSQGRFTIDSPISSNSNNPDNPVPTPPDDIEIPSNTVQTTIKRVYETQVALSFKVDVSYAKKFSQMGYCWGTNYLPTVIDNNKNVYLKQDGSGNVECDFSGVPGTTYYLRPYALVDNEIIYFDQQKVQTVGGDIKLTVTYSSPKNKMVIDYDIKKEGTYELYFYAALTSTVGNSDEGLGFINKGKGQKYATNYSCYYCLAYLKEISTGIEYYSNTYKKYNYFFTPKYIKSIITYNENNRNIYTIAYMHKPNILQ